MSIFKAYDIRGLVDEEITPDFCFATGVALARFLKGEREPGTVVIGEDMRPSSPIFATAFSAGITSQGLDVIRIGLASTDMLYFASGKLNMPGAMFTASHNPAEYNGIKLCLSGARPIGRESGLLTIEKFLNEGSPLGLGAIGVEKEENLLDAYVEHLFTLVDLTEMSPLKVVIDAGNGYWDVILVHDIFKPPGIPEFYSFRCPTINLFDYLSAKNIEFDAKSFGL